MCSPHTARLEEPPVIEPNGQLKRGHIKFRSDTLAFVAYEAPNRLSQQRNAPT
jgi:hypothetical protein